MQLHDIRPFLEHYAPCHVDANTVSECLENIRKQEDPVIEKDELGVYRWLPLEFSLRDRGTLTEGKKEMPAGPLQKIIQSIQLNLRFSSGKNPNRKRAMGLTLSEGCPIEGSSIFGGTHLTDTIVPTLGEADDHQILATCRHIMDEDPRRMWIYGLTYEDNGMSAWYFSRAHAVGTHSFDCHQNPEYLVELVLSFISATPEQLGIDPLVHKCPNDANQVSPSYVYEIPNAAAGVPPVFYKTGQCRYQERRSSVQGRGTRVWEVTQVRSTDGLQQVNPEQLAVLKDVWLDVNAPTEDETMKAIFKSVDDFVEVGLKARVQDQLNKNPNFDYNAVSMQRLLTEFIDMDERFADFDDMVKRRLREHLTDRNYRSFFLTNLHSWQGRTSQHGVLQSVPKRQFRCVFKEVCKDLRSVGTLGNLMEIINQTLDALRILYCAGWVHRDISKGNLLVVQDTLGKWKLKLSDFELSKLSGHGDERIGTPYFMPHEVLKEHHLLHRHRESDMDDSLAIHFNLPEGSPEYEHLKDINKNFCRRFRALPPNTTKYIPNYDAAVRYNFQHDLEALWWLVHYCITKWVDHQPSHDYAEFVFQKTFTMSAERNECLFYNFKSLGGRSLHPRIKVPFSDFMEKLRAAMYEEYVAREAFGQLDIHRSYSYIHNFFANRLHELQQHDDNDWKEISIVCSPEVLKAGQQHPPAATKQDQAKAAVRARHKRLKRGHK